jgi:hypothetical protein
MAMVTDRRRHAGAWREAMTVSERSRRDGSRATLAGLCAFLFLGGVAIHPACIDSQKLHEAFDPCAGDGCAPPPPQDCASLSAADWAVDGNLTAPEAEIPLGESSRSSLSPAVESHCEGAITSVEWHADDPSIVELAPAERFVWITGLGLGSTTLGARVSFADGVVRDARGRGVRVVEATAATGEAVLEGELSLPPYVPPGGSGEPWRAWVPFTTTATGRIDVLVDWVSPLNRIDVVGFAGHCSSAGTCGSLVMSGGEVDLKPRHGTFDNPRTPPGDYTLRIDNLGPGDETVRYEVRLTPN